MKNVQQYEEYQAIISSLPDIVFVLTESGKYAAVVGGGSSEQYHEGLSLIGKNLFDVLPESKARWFIDKIEATLNTNKLQICEYSLGADEVDTIDPTSGPDGSLRFEGRVSPLKSLRDGERAVVWVARNITTRYQLERQLVHQAEFDSLSNLYNRRKLFSCLEETYTNFINTHQNACFLLLDIDNFKQVNDQYGHQAGDRIVTKLASLLQAWLTPNDIVGRIGGDEFGIIFNGSLDEAQSFSDKINDLLESDPSPIPISLSIGCSKFRIEDRTTDSIYKRADMALYQSKKAGKRRCTLN